MSMEIERISIARQGDWYSVKLAVNGIPCAFQPCIFEFWELEDEFGGGTERFYQALAVKCLVAKVEEATYWMQNGYPSVRSERDRAITLIGQLRAALQEEIAQAEQIGMSAAA